MTLEIKMINRETKKVVYKSKVKYIGNIMGKTPLERLLEDLEDFDKSSGKNFHKFKYTITE